jgi:hypothetical protein
MKESSATKSMLKKQHEASLQATLNRARSVTVGTCFGGTVEISMRGNDGVVLWSPLQPVEAIELIHQLAASVGCHIHIQPRRDFSSWRDWKHSEEELDRYRGVQNLPGVGHPPHANKTIAQQIKGQVLPAPEQQPGLQPALMARSNENEQTVATEKTVGRKRTKRAAAAA